MICRSAIGVLAALLPVLACAAPAHEHGVARLDAGLDGRVLEVTLDSPLANLVGFEHAPTTEAQRLAVVGMVKRLRDVVGVLATNDAARCTLGPVHMASGVLPPAMLGEAVTGATPKTPHEEAGHADLEVSWRFDCARPEALRELRVGLFAAFGGFRIIRVQAAGPHGQAYAELTAGAPVFDWKQVHE